MKDLLDNCIDPRKAPIVRCLKCKDEIQSTYRHDFSECGCGNIFVDGGTDYFRYGGHGLSDNSAEVWNPNLMKWEPLGLGETEDADKNLLERMQREFLRFVRQSTNQVKTWRRSAHNRGRSWWKNR